MVGFFHGRRLPAACRIRRPVRLVIESLETRDLCSAGWRPVDTQSGFDGGQRTGPATGAIQVPAQTSARPTIADFEAIEEAPGIWTFRGRVTGDDMVGRDVTLGGLPSLNGKVVQVEESGWFYCTVQLQAGEHGKASAQTSDWLGHLSNLAVTHVPRR